MIIKIKDCLAEIISDYQGNGKEFVNFKYDEYIGMDILHGENNYILSYNLWELMSNKYGFGYGDDDAFVIFHEYLYSVCHLMNYKILPIQNDEIPFYISCKGLK